LGFKPLAKQRIRDLALIRQSGASPRFFDVALRAQAAHRAGAPMLFDIPVLNRTLLIKHTLREREREEIYTERRTATKIVFPIDINDLSQGGYALFIEEAGFARHLSEFLGSAQNVEALPDDLRRLRLCARAPMFDPFLLRELFRMDGFTPDDRWFKLEAGREQAVINGIFEHIRQMFLGATGDPHLAKKFADGFCFKVFSGEFADYAEHLNEFFGLGSGHMVEALFAWKMVLYQRQVFDEMRGRLAHDFRMLLDAALPVDSQSNDAAFMRQVQLRLRHTVRQRFSAALVQLAAYNTAYSDFAERKKPAGFIQFLRDSQRIAFELGENIALLMHYAGLLGFRIGRENALRAAGPAIELHQDLALNLDADECEEEPVRLAAV
jgi:hypothetical protein